MLKNNKNYDWKKQRQFEYLEKREFRYYIFCEGEKTEPQYFEGFKEMIEKSPIYRDMVLVRIEPRVGETLYILDQAQKFIHKNNVTNSHVWCVYDKDDFPAKRFDLVEKTIEELNQKPENGVYFHAAWSNQCIEFWFILHFSFYLSNTNRKAYMEYLDKRFKEKGYEKYQKNMKETFDILQTYGNIDNAIKFAKRIISDNEGKNPSEIAPGTKVYELVEELRKYIL